VEAARSAPATTFFIKRNAHLSVKIENSRLGIASLVLETRLQIALIHHEEVRIQYERCMYT
jgi:hypothetical protein